VRLGGRGGTPTQLRGTREAFGAPGTPPHWAHGNKEGVGTAYSQDSKVWFTLFRGCLTEVYYPLIDHPQTRDMGYLVTDGSTFFHEERRHLRTETHRLTDHTLGYRVVSRDPAGRYALHKEVIAAPHLPVVLQHTRVEVEPSLASRLKLYALVAPHLTATGWGNNAYVVEQSGRTLLAAERGGTWLVLGASTPFRRASVGYVGASDGWADLNDHKRLDWEFDRALNGNVALTGELPADLPGGFTLALAFGDEFPAAVSALFQALGTPYDELRHRFREQWDRPASTLADRRPLTSDAGNLYHASYSLLLAHEDKTYLGAFIASLSIPWGNAQPGEEMGGYHLVWTRDMVHIATGLLAAGDTETPRRTLIYLAASQQPDGAFPQNFWLNGMPYWHGLQLDEVAFPILLAWRLARGRALGSFDPYPMVRAAARFLVTHGPATGQERWEEAAGFSPSTLAVDIAGLLCAAELCRARGDTAAADFLTTHADFLEQHVEGWTVTTRGTLDPAVPRHYLRILPASPDDPTPTAEPDTAELTLANQPPGAPTRYPAREIVDAGFLELVRYGVRRPDDPLVVDSVKVVDRVLKVDTPFGPCWRRYNHDGYGQQDDGGPYTGWGTGRAWPLLTGERAHYELAAGRDPRPLLHAMERFATGTGLLSEQVWDAADRPASYLWRGRPTGAAMPLMWAHAEYLSLLRSVADGAVFDRIPFVYERYAAHPDRTRPFRELWTFTYRPARVRSDARLRVQAEARFRLHVSVDGWRTVEDRESTTTSLGVHYVDLESLPAPGGLVVFTFYWPDVDRWEGRDFQVQTR
jgi:glucoamylase